MRKVDYLIHGKELSVKLRFMSPQMEKSFKRIISNIRRHIIIGIHAIVQIYLALEGKLELTKCTLHLVATLNILPKNYLKVLEKPISRVPLACLNILNLNS